MKRREFIALLSGAAAAWPLAARGQQSDQMLRIGVLIPFAEGDVDSQARVRVFQETLQQLGWTEGQNIRIDTSAFAAIRGHSHIWPFFLYLQQPPILACPPLFAPVYWTYVGHDPSSPCHSGNGSKKTLLYLAF